MVAVGNHVHRTHSHPLPLCRKHLPSYDVVKDHDSQSPIAGGWTFDLSMFGKQKA